MGWSSFPPEHKRSLFRAVALYAGLAALAGGWIWMHADATVREWNSRIPQAVAPVKAVYSDTSQQAEFGKSIDLPPPAPGEGYVSIIMTGMGVSDSDTARAMEDLPPAVTLAFSPYGANNGDWLGKAKDANRETLMLIPMEPGTYPWDDPGPDALLTRQSDSDNARRLERVLRQGGPSVGAMNFMGSSILADEKNITAVLTALQKRGGIFIENPQGGETIAEEIAQRIGLPYLKTDVRIDEKATDLSVRQALVALENAAKTRGYAVGVAQPYPVTFGILKAWADSLDRRGIKLVPLAGLWKAKGQHDKAQPQE